MSRGQAQEIIKRILHETKEAMKSPDYGNVNLPYLGTFKIAQRNAYGVCRQTEKTYLDKKISLEEAQQFIKYVYDNEDNPKRLYKISGASRRFRELQVDREFGNPYALIPEEEESAHLEKWRSYHPEYRSETAVGTDEAGSSDRSGPVV